MNINEDLDLSFKFDIRLMIWQILSVIMLVFLPEIVSTMRMDASKTKVNVDLSDFNVLSCILHLRKIMLNIRLNFPLNDRSFLYC